MTTSERRVVSTDGVELAVYETGLRTGPTVVAVHGYPDNHTVWDGVVAQLADRFHVVTYDVRGTGKSDKPVGRSSYRMPQLIDDLEAVLDEVSPNAPVHLLAHDWGSIQSWPAVTAPRLEGRFATYTSISGPSLDYASHWLRDLRAHRSASVRQLAHSYYIFVFQLPGLPEFLVRSGILDRLVGMSSRGARRSPSAVAETRSEADKINGISLYRANMLSRLGRPRPVPANLPVQLIVPDGDAFVTPPLAVGSVGPWVSDLTVTPVSGGHWIVSLEPDVIAELFADFVTARLALHNA
jgi:pimeloyl-ACP methyl ester carboxylesterase